MVIDGNPDSEILNFASDHREVEEKKIHFCFNHVPPCIAKTFASLIHITI